jgi:hypothetical protein
MCWCDPQKRTPICDNCPPEKKADWPQYVLCECGCLLISEHSQHGCSGCLPACVKPKPDLREKCRLCESLTNTVCNIRLKAVPICDFCCLAVTKQEVATWSGDEEKI